MKNVPLGDIATLVRGVSFSKEEGSLLPLEGHLPVIRAGSIQASLLLREGQIWVPSDKIKSTQKIRIDDIVMCTSSGSSDLVGKCARSTEDFDGSFGAFCVGIRADQEKASPSYLYHFLCSPVFKNWTSASSGANIKNIRVSELAEFQVPLPPLPEQKHIAAILDKADAIRRKRQQAIQLADDFLRAVFLDMFGDPVTNPKGWPTMRVDELCAIVRGSSPRPQGDPRFYGGPVPRLMVADLTRDGKLVTPMIDSLTTEGAKKSRPIEAGTVVMAVSGNVGLTSVLAIDACIHDGFIAFKELDVNKVKPAFLCELMMFLKSTHASRQAGAIFQNLTTSQIKEMEIPIPPSALQDKFLSISRKATELYGEEGFSLFESLSQRAFSGQL